MEAHLLHKKNKILILISALGWWLLHVLALYKLGLNIKIALIDSTVNNSLLFAVCFGTSHMMRWLDPDKKKASIKIVSLSLIAFFCAKIAALIIAALCTSLLPHLLNDTAAYTEMLKKTVLIRFAIALLLITWVALANWFFNSLSQQQAGEKQKNDSEKLLREAELMDLRQQLQPHFLFNSLNSINALVVTKPEEARKMIQQLSGFLRGTLKKDEQTFISFQEELKHLQLYLEIEKVRFGHRLHLDFLIDEDSCCLLIPPLLLQPIVENAIKFGLYDTTGEVTIKIIAKKENKNLKINISNPFDPETAQPNKGIGFGLSSINRRLYLLFYQNNLVQTSTHENTFTTTLIIPQSS
ncbi:MAG: histidine kinase [Bacteroidetes bacterium]|nr:histidine kinase [Bacteroidota bacterium]